jgi:hypothetical protein
MYMCMYMYMYMYMYIYTLSKKLCRLYLTKRLCRPHHDVFPDMRNPITYSYLWFSS